MYVKIRFKTNDVGDKPLRPKQIVNTGHNCFILVHLVQFEMPSHRDGVKRTGLFARSERNTPGVIWSL